MSGKYMKTKRILIPMVTIILSTSLLFGCGSVSQEEAQQLINETPTVEVVVNEPVSGNEIEETFDSLPWIEVGKQDNLADFRAVFDTVFNVTGDAGSKTGWAYSSYDTQNITLQGAMKEYDSTLYLYSEGNPETVQLINAVDSSFTDTDDLTDEEKIAILLNEYFSLLPSEEEGTANPYEVLTRAQAMTILMRATTPVHSIESNTEFISAVGVSEYNDYAQEVNELAFLSTLDGSLDADTYYKPMTRAEATFMIVQAFYKNEYDRNAYADEELQFTDIEVSDSISGSTNAEYLDAMISSNSVDPRIMDAYKVASHHGLFDEDVTESEWNENITKVEFIQLIVRALGPDMVDYENSEDYDDAEEDPVLPGNSMTTITADDSNTPAPATTDDGGDFSDIWDKDPSQYTDAEVAYINSLFPGLPKDPRQMTDADWDSYFATAYGTPSGSGSSGSGSSTSTTDNSSYTPAATGTVAPNGLIAQELGDGNYGDGTATLY